jgi:cell division protein FtsQ
MDYRGRELFEVGQKPISNWQAPLASLLSLPYDQIRRFIHGDIQEQNMLADQDLPPVAVSGSRRGPRAARWRLRAGLALTAIVAAFGLSALGLSTDQGRAMRQRLAAVADADAVAAGLGFGIDQVTLSGHKFTFDRDVFDVLDLANARSYASFDAKAAKDRIERLPWVSTAELTRVYPDRLDIRIRERAPYAVWARGEQTYLIDVTGRVLSAVSGALPPNLPRLAGEGAAAEAGEFLALLDRYPSIHTRFESATRVGERRWTLKLAGRVTLELPADGEAQVLESMTRDAALVRVVERGNATLDFRAPGRIAVRKTADPAVQEPRPEPRS